ncbi:hypothetical protein [Ruminiclostridium papyrosolvens]|uniref:Uncharacterized protein n=1 Tax=Ruminiclostridium papyrosolvens C7 TaxID=1330534 RepID=U4QWQ0_9FIRM|nr:hypothetical protein [Ruminiclostridium papyrosolvens]EPR07698.1 hypothetical protein L323_19170 [Ruminiclostridium papyrosolvens C7]
MSNVKKLIGMGLGLAILISSMSFAFAANSEKSSDTAKPKYQNSQMFKGKGGFKKPAVLESLVKAGTITSDQQKAICEALKPSKDTQNTIKESLDSLVKAGTITQAQEDAVVKTFDNARAQKPADKKGAFKGKNQKHINVLDSLVTAGTITADQQKAIREALKPSKDTQNTIKESLDSLVKAGTITQAQEDAVVKAFDDAKAKVEADREKKLEELAAKKGITIDELKSQMKQGRKAFKKQI